MTAPVSIIIPAFNQLEYCRQCVESLRANTDYPYKLILVDNGSSDGVAEYFDAVPGAIVVHSERNLGFPAGINLGLKHAEGHVLLLNSDTVLPRAWLSRLVCALEQEPRVGIVGPMSNCVSGLQLIPGLDLESMNDINTFSDALYDRHGHALSDVERAIGFCMLIRDAAFAEVGGMDESFGIGNFEDDDYCLRVRKAGYRICIAKGSFVFHFGSRTFHAMGYSDESFDALIARNESTFNAKWGTLPGIARSEQIAAHLVDRAKGHLASGDIMSALGDLKEAISLNPRSAAAFRLLGEVIQRAGDASRANEYFARADSLDSARD